MIDVNSDVMYLYKKDMDNHDLLTSHELINLFSIYRDESCTDDQRRNAYDTIVESNLGLVFKVLRDGKYTGSDKSDLIQYGNMGLMRAVEKFDPSLGYKFSTYAYYWIHQSMARGRECDSSMIRKPSHVYITMRRIKREKESLKDVSLTDRDLADKLGLRYSEYKLLDRSSKDTLSLDFEYGSGSTLSDVIKDKGQMTQDKAADSFAIDIVKNVINDVLSDRERDIIHRRYYLNQTLVEVGSAYSMSRERIRQIQNESLFKLKMYFIEQGIFNELSDAF